MIPAFDHADMVDLRAAVGNADALILSLYRMMEINYFRGTDGLVVRFDEDAVKSILQGDRALWFVRNFHFVEYSHAERQDLVRASLQWLSKNSADGCKIIVLLENKRRLENYPDEIFHRASYNELITDQAAKIAKVRFVDVNRVTNEEWLTARASAHPAWGAKSVSGNSAHAPGNVRNLQLPESPLLAPSCLPQPLEATPTARRAPARR